MAETVVRLTEVPAGTAHSHLVDGVVTADGQDGGVAPLPPPPVGRLGVAGRLRVTYQSHGPPGHSYRLLGEDGGSAGLVTDIDHHGGVLLSPLPQLIFFYEYMKNNNFLI